MRAPPKSGVPRNDLAYIRRFMAGPPRLSGSLYGDVWKAAGDRAPAPPVKQFDEEDLSRHGLSSGQAWGFQPNDDRSVHLDPEVVARLQRLSLGFSPGPRSPGGKTVDPRGLDALNALVHEYAHVNQPRPLQNWLREAGATEWSGRQMNRVLGALGQQPVERYFPYPYMRERDRLWREQGSGANQFIDRGQFGRP